MLHPPFDHLSTHELDSVVQKYQDTLTTVIDQHAPIISKTLVARPKVSWYNRELKQQTFVSHERHLILQGNWVEDGVPGAKIKVKLPREHDCHFCSLTVNMTGFQEVRDVLFLSFEHF